MTSSQPLSAAASRLKSASSPSSNLSLIFAPHFRRESDCSYVVTTQLPHEAHIIYSTLHQACALPTPVISVSDLNSGGQQPSSAAASHHQGNIWVIAPALLVVIGFVYCVWKFCYERPRLGIRRRGQQNAHTQSGHSDFTPRSSRQRDDTQTFAENERGVNVHKTSRTYAYREQKWTNTPGRKARQDGKKNVGLTEPSERPWLHKNTGDQPPSKSSAAQLPLRQPPPRQPPPRRPPPDWRREETQTTPYHPSPSRSARYPLPNPPPTSWHPETSSAARREAWNEIRAERRRVELHRPSFASIAAEPDFAGVSSDFSEDTLVSSQLSPPTRSRMEQMEIDDGYTEEVRDRERGGIKWVLETLGVFRMGRWAWRPGRG